MGKIICQITNGKKVDAIRFVKNVGKGILRNRTEFTFNVFDALYLSEEIPECIMRTVRNKKTTTLFYNLRKFYEEKSFNKFFVIVDNKGRFYTSRRGKGAAEFSIDIDEALIMAVKSVAEDTLKTIRATKNVKAYIETIYITWKNLLLSQMFMILCTSCSTGETKFFNTENGEISLKNYSDEAILMSYDEANACFDTLRQKHKEYRYSILPKFRHNIKYTEMEEYVKREKVSRVISVAFRMRNVNKNI